MPPQVLVLELVPERRKESEAQVDVVIVRCPLLAAAVARAVFPPLPSDLPFPAVPLRSVSMIHLGT